MNLTNILKKRFKLFLENYHRNLWASPLTGEINFIDRTVDSFKSLKISAGRQSLKARSKRIHLTPMVEYYPFGRLFPNVHTTVEMGDLLFVYKHFLNGLLNAYRAAVVQVKHTKGKRKSWSIKTDQFFFLTHWPTFRIVKPKFRKWFLIKPEALTWATYGFVGPNATRYPLYYSSKRILRYKRTVPSTKSFSFHTVPRTGWDSSTSFLLKFVQGSVGENLLSSARVNAFVDDLYVVAGWKPDPPGEPKWDNEKNEEREGFGIVEFTVTRNMEVEEEGQS